MRYFSEMTFAGAAVLLLFFFTKMNAITRPTSAMAAQPKYAAPAPATVDAARSAPPAAAWACTEDMMVTSTAVEMAPKT